MSSVTASLEPQAVFHFFEEISRIPRPSGKEEAIASYLVAFAEERGLEWHRDEANNVILIRTASHGREQDAPLILQGHMDMVCEKESSCVKDMDLEGLDLVLIDDWLSAEGTTLGADDGIAVAYALALLDDPDLSCPRLEFLCTTEEETGMGGAQALDATPLTGKLLLNIDSETEGVLTVGCAGGDTLHITLPLIRELGAPDKALVPVCLRISGLTGGHSGTEIHRGRANADLLLVRVLRTLFATDPAALSLISLSGGSKNNAIPREAEAYLLVRDRDVLQTWTAAQESILQAEYAISDPDLSLSLSDATPHTELPRPLTTTSTQRLLTLLTALPNGVQRMDQHLDGLVETSLNLGILSAEEEELYIETLLRSSVDSALDALAEQVIFLSAALGASVQRSDRYPAWEYLPKSPLRDTMTRLFREQYGKEPVVETIHAGLECGLLAQKIPGLDAVSIGPDIPDIHTPQERLSISSVQRTYTYLRAIVEEKIG